MVASELIEHFHAKLLLSHLGIQSDADQRTVAAMQTEWESRKTQNVSQQIMVPGSRNWRQAAVWPIPMRRFRTSAAERVRTGPPVGKMPRVGESPRIQKWRHACQSPRTRNSPQRPKSEHILSLSLSRKVPDPCRESDQNARPAFFFSHRVVGRLFSLHLLNSMRPADEDWERELNRSDELDDRAIANIFRGGWIWAQQLRRHVSGIYLSS